MTTIAIVGAGPGLGAAVARRFGTEELLRCRHVPQPGPGRRPRRRPDQRPG